MILERFGKPFGALSSFKADLFEHNAEELARSLALAECYVGQPRRERCKLCTALLPTAAAFVKHRVPYVFCTGCGHLNGVHDDTAAFAERVYLREDYGRAYSAAGKDDYRARVDAIYLPKADFLYEGLSHHGYDARALAYADLGAGSGHFLAALALRGLPAQAWELAESQVRHGNAMLSLLGIGARLQALPDGIESIYAAASALRSPVVSLIGVLEHLPDPHRLLAALAGNSTVRFLYLSLPLYSLSVLIEASFPDIAPRQLTGGHTHLFTESSLAYLEQRYRMSRLAAWWFGSDCLDLQRALRITLESHAQTADLAGELDGVLAPLLDSWQLALDCTKGCSEVHLLYALER